MATDMYELLRKAGAPVGESVPSYDAEVQKRLAEMAQRRAFGATGAPSVTPATVPTAVPPAMDAGSIWEKPISAWGALKATGRGALSVLRSRPVGMAAAILPGAGALASKMAGGSAIEGAVRPDLLTNALGEGYARYAPTWLGGLPASSVAAGDVAGASDIGGDFAARGTATPARVAAPAVSQAGVNTWWNGLPSGTVSEEQRGFGARPGDIPEGSLRTTQGTIVPASQMFGPAGGIVSDSQAAKGAPRGKLVIPEVVLDPYLTENMSTAQKEKLKETLTASRKWYMENNREYFEQAQSTPQPGRVGAGRGGLINRPAADAEELAAQKAAREQYLTPEQIADYEKNGKQPLPNFENPLHEPRGPFEQGAWRVKLYGHGDSNIPASGTGAFTSGRGAIRIVGNPNPPPPSPAPEYQARTPLGMYFGATRGLQQKTGEAVQQQAINKLLMDYALKAPGAQESASKTALHAATLELAKQAAAKGATPAEISLILAGRAGPAPSYSAVPTAMPDPKTGAIPMENRRTGEITLQVPKKTMKWSDALADPASKGKTRAEIQAQAAKKNIILTD